MFNTVGCNVSSTCVFGMLECWVLEQRDYHLPLLYCLLLTSGTSLYSSPAPAPAPAWQTTNNQIICWIGGLNPVKFFTPSLPSGWRKMRNVWCRLSGKTLAWRLICLTNGPVDTWPLELETKVKPRFAKVSTVSSARPLWYLHRHPNFTSTYCGV